MKKKTYLTLSCMVGGLILIKPSIYDYRNHTNDIMEFLVYFLFALVSIIGLMFYTYYNHYSGNILRKNFLNLLIYLTILIMALIGLIPNEVPALMAMFAISIFCLPIIGIVAMICYFDERRNK